MKTHTIFLVGFTRIFNNIPFLYYGLSCAVRIVQIVVYNRDRFHYLLNSVVVRSNFFSLCHFSTYTWLRPVSWISSRKRTQFCVNDTILDWVHNSLMMFRGGAPDNFCVLLAVLLFLETEQRCESRYTREACRKVSLLGVWCVGG